MAFAMVLISITVCIVFIWLYTKEKKESLKLKEELAKNKLYFNILNVWFSQEQRGKKLADYLKKLNYFRVAIYGMNAIGERLYHELINNGIEITCVIDKSPYILGEFLLIGPNETVPQVDVIIVSAEYYIEEVRKNYSNISVPIIGMSEVIGNAFKMNF